MRNSLLAFAGILAAALVATPLSAASIVYTGSQQIGEISAKYSITTNGTLGSSIDAKSIEKFDVALSQGANVTNFSSSGGIVFGSFSASSTELLFGQYESLFFASMQFINGSYTGSLNTGYGSSFAQLVTSNVALFENAARTTNVFASAQVVSPSNPTAAAVPEPATWAMMLVGFGGIGFAMRRRKSKVMTTVAYA